MPFFLDISFSQMFWTCIPFHEHQWFEGHQSFQLFLSKITKCWISVLHLSDHSDVAPEKNHRSTDSDNEEFCDSMEHLAMEEVLYHQK